VNEILQAYVVDTKFPGVSGIEHLEMLKRRSKLAEMEQYLSSEESRQLVEADTRLVAHASEFLAELSRFVDLAEERRRLRVPSAHWWWYLDVLMLSPTWLTSKVEPELVTA